MTAWSTLRLATWRGLTTFDPCTGTAALSFDVLHGDTVRLRLALPDLEAVHSVVGDLLAQRPGTKAQSASSSGNPSPLGSPHDGQYVQPPATSAAAISGLAYEPRSSSSNQGCQRPSRLWRMLNRPFRGRNTQRPATADPSLTHANRLIDESSRFSPGDATRFLFDHYRCARPEMQDAIVLALIGSVLTSRAMRAAQARSASTGGSAT